MIAIDHVVQNRIDLVDILGVMRDKRLVEPVNNFGLDKKGFPICYIDDNSDDNRDMEGEEDAEDKKLDCKQNQKTLCIPNARYFNPKYNLLKNTN